MSHAANILRGPPQSNNPLQNVSQSDSSSRKGSPADPVLTDAVSRPGWQGVLVSCQRRMLPTCDICKATCKSFGAPPGGASTLCSLRHEDAAKSAQWVNQTNQVPPLDEGQYMVTLLRLRSLLRSSCCCYFSWAAALLTVIAAVVQQHRVVAADASRRQLSNGEGEKTCAQSDWLLFSLPLSLPLHCPKVPDDMSHWTPVEEIPSHGPRGPPLPQTHHPVHAEGWGRGTLAPLPEVAATQDPRYPQGHSSVGEWLTLSLPTTANAIVR